MNNLRPARLVRVMTVPISIRYILQGQLRHLGQRGYEVYAVSADGPEVAAILEQEKCTHIVVPFTRRITPIRDLLCLVKLVVILRRIKPEIVHTQTPKAGLLGILAAWLARVPVRIHTVGGLPVMEAKGLRRLVLSWSDRTTYALATQIYSNSVVLRDYLISVFRIPKSKIDVIGNGSSNGIDTVRYSRGEAVVASAKQLRREHSIADDDLVFCFVGRLVKDKGVEELVKAFLRLVVEKKNLKLILLGHFESELDPLDQLTQETIKTHESIIAPGFRSDVSTYLAASDVFVFPSYREGFPNVVLQACAMELPSIVTDINGSNEIIRHGENGLVVKPRDVEGLFDAMKRLAEDPALRKLLASQGRAEVVEKYDQLAFLKKLEVAYQKQITDRVPRNS